MNMLSTITADPVDAAIEKANAWVVPATPIIKAYLALDDVDGDLGSAWLAAHGKRKFGTPKNYAEDVCDQARSDVKHAIGNLYKLIEAVREDFICDAWFNEPAGPSDDSNEAAAAYDTACDLCDEANDRLKRETVGVDAAIRKVGRF